MSKATRSISLATVFSLLLTSFITPAQAYTLSSPLINPAAHQVRFNANAVVQPVYWGGKPIKDTFKRESLRRLVTSFAEAARVPTKFLNFVKYRLEPLGRIPVLLAKDLATLINHTSGVSIQRVQTVPIHEYFRAADPTPNKAAFGNVPMNKDLSLVGGMRIAVALLRSGYHRSDAGLDEKAGKDERTALKRTADLIAEGVLGQAARDLRKKLRFLINENKSEVPGSIQTGEEIGDPTGEAINVVVDALEGTGAYVSDSGYQIGGSSSLYLESSGMIAGKFPDNVRALMVAANIDHSRAPALLEIVNAENKMYDQPLISTVEELLDSELEPHVLINRIAFLNGVSPDDIDVTVLSNGDGKGGKYEEDALKRFKKEAKFGNMQINAIDSGTVRPSVGAILGAKDGKRVKVFLGRSGMTEAYWSLGLAAAMKDKGGYANFTVVPESVKDNRAKALSGLFTDTDARYSLFDTRTDDWAELTLRKKKFSMQDAEGTLRGSYTFVTDTPSDDGWPMQLPGAKQDEGTSNYTVHALQFTNGHVRMVRMHAKAKLPLPGLEAKEIARDVHPGEHEKLPTLTDLLKHPKIASLFNLGFAPAIEKALLHLPGPDFLKKRFKKVTQQVKGDDKQWIENPLFKEVESQMEEKRNKFVPEVSPWNAEQAAVSIYLNLKKIFDHGNLGGTGYLSILPVDQGIEHINQTFAQNEEMSDPINIMRLAIASGTNAAAIPLGALETVGEAAPELLAQMPVIAKIDHADTMSTPEGSIQNYFGGFPEQSVERAYVAGATAIGMTLYMGLPANEFRIQVQEAGRAITRARQLGLPVVLWTYVRNPDAAVNSLANAADITSQANYIGATLGAHIIKQKLPEQEGAFLALKKKNVDARYYNELVTTHVTDRVRAQIWGNYLGHAPLINSGGASTGKGILADAIDAVYTAFGNLLGGGTGEIMGRKAFQKLFVEGVHLIKLVQAVYLLAVPFDKLSDPAKAVLNEVSGQVRWETHHEKHYPLITRLAGAV